MAIFNMGDGSKSDLSYKIVYSESKPSTSTKNLIWIQTGGDDNQLKIMAPAEKEQIISTQMNDTEISLNRRIAAQGAQYDSSYIYGYFSMATGDTKYVFTAPEKAEMTVGIGSTVNNQVNNGNTFTSLYHIDAGGKLELSNNEISIVNAQEIYLNYKRNYQDVYFYVKSRYYYKNPETNEYLLDASDAQVEGRTYYIKNKNGEYEEIVLTQFKSKTYYIATFESADKNKYYKDVDYYERIEDGDGKARYIKTKDTVTIENFNLKDYYRMATSVIRMDNANVTALNNNQTQGWFEETQGLPVVERTTTSDQDLKGITINYYYLADETRIKFEDNIIWFNSSVTTKYCFLKKKHKYKITNITNDSYIFGLTSGKMLPMQGLGLEKSFDKENLIQNPIITGSETEDYYLVYSFKENGQSPIIEDVTLEERFSEFFKDKIKDISHSTQISAYEPEEIFVFGLNEEGKEEKVSSLTWIKIEDSADGSFNAIKNNDKILSIKPCAAIKGFKLDEFKQEYNLNINQDYAYGFLSGGVLYPEEGNDNIQMKFIPFIMGKDKFNDIRSLIERNIINLKNKDASKVGPYAFYNYSALNSIELPNCLEVQSSAFIGCVGLTSVSLPKCSIIYSNAFSGCANLEYINLSNCTSVVGNTAAFSGCTKIKEFVLGYSSIPANNTHPFALASKSLETIHLPNCTYIGLSAFKQNNALKKVTNNNKTLQIVQQAAFESCTSLVSFPFDGVTSIEAYAFNNCGFSDVLNLSNLNVLSSCAFQNCQNLTGIIANNCSKITFPVFNSTPKIQKVQLNAFSGTFYANAFPSAKSSLNNIEIKSVTALPNACFEGYSVLNSINLGSSCLTIGSTCFKNCYSLGIFSNIAIGNGEEMNGIAGVKILGNYAFENCYNNLEELYLPNVTTVGEGAFKNCSALTVLKLPNCSSWNTGSGSRNVLYSCKNLQSLTIGQITGTFPLQIGSGTASNALTNIQFISMPLITGLTNYCFANCTNLSDFNLTSCNTIGNYAFSNCTSLRDINNKFSPSLSSIGERAFLDCINLGAILVNDEVGYQSQNFPNVTTIGVAAFQNCKNLQSIIIPVVKTIGNDAFSGATNLLKIDFPSSLTAIGQNAFYNCSKLSSINFNENISTFTIGSNAFGKCGTNTSNRLTKVVLPSIFKGPINANTFKDCLYLDTIVLNYTSGVIVLSASNAFEGTKIPRFQYIDGNDQIQYSQGSIYVPASLVSAYQAAANWKIYSDMIHPISDLI